MTDQPVREPMPPDPKRDRTDEAPKPLDATRPPVRPSKAEGAEENAGPRPPRPSKAEGER